MNAVKLLLRVVKEWLTQNCHKCIIYFEEFLKKQKIRLKIKAIVIAV